MKKVGDCRQDRNDEQGQHSDLHGLVKQPSQGAGKQHPASDQVADRVDHELLERLNVAGDARQDIPVRGPTAGPDGR